MQNNKNNNNSKTSEKPSTDEIVEEIEVKAAEKSYELLFNDKNDETKKVTVSSELFDGKKDILSDIIETESITSENSQTSSSKMESPPQEDSSQVDYPLEDGTILHCPRCTAEKAGNVCSVCSYNFDSESQSPPYLKENSLLSGRYVSGLLLSSANDAALYLGYDMIRSDKVMIREFYPKTICSRGENKREVVPNKDKIPDFKAWESEFYDIYSELYSARKNEELALSLLEIRAVFRENNTVYVVLNYYEGRSLKSWLNSHPDGRVSWEEAREIFSPLIKTLMSVHSLGIIHRAISPTNIFVGKKGEVIITGFRTAMGGIGSNKTSPFYAPEVYIPAGQHSRKTDIYSFCATLYRALTGFNPQPADERAIKDEIKEYGFDILLGVPTFVEKEILRGLSLNPEERTPYFAELEGVLFPPDFVQNTAYSKGSKNAVRNATMEFSSLKKSETSNIELEKISPLPISNESQNIFSSGEYAEKVSNNDIVSSEKNGARNPKWDTQKLDKLDGDEKTPMARRYIFLICFLGFSFLFIGALFLIAYTKPELVENILVNCAGAKQTGDDTENSNSYSFSLSGMQTSETSDNSGIAEGLVEIPPLVGKFFEPIKTQYGHLFVFYDEWDYGSQDYGIIYESDHEGGEIVGEHSVIQVKVSAGRQYVSIPEYEGKLLNVYEEELQKLGIKYVLQGHPDSKYKSNQVIGINGGSLGGAFNRGSLENPNVLTVIYNSFVPQTIDPNPTTQPTTPPLPSTTETVIPTTVPPAITTTTPGMVIPTLPPHLTITTTQNTTPPTLPPQTTTEQPLTEPVTPVGEDEE